LQFVLFWIVQYGTIIMIISSYRQVVIYFHKVEEL